MKMAGGGYCSVSPVSRRTKSPCYGSRPWRWRQSTLWWWWSEHSPVEKPEERREKLTSFGQQLYKYRRPWSISAIHQGYRVVLFIYTQHTLFRPKCQLKEPLPWQWRWLEDHGSVVHFHCLSLCVPEWFSE